MEAPVFPRARRVPFGGHAGTQGVAHREPDRRRLRRPEPGVRLSTDRELRDGRMTSWSVVVDHAGRNGPENMAIDQMLLEEAGRTRSAFLRLYRWDPPCLSFGRNEPALTRYDRAEIERRG